jgi:ribosome-associated toxin RatA of RatAB toxin-antitoxin module
MYRRYVSLMFGIFAATCCLGQETVAIAAPKAATRAQRFTVRTPYSSIEAGAARIDVAAASQQVSEIVLDFGNYTKLTDRFDKSRVVGHAGANTDVYLQVPILKGAAKIWAVVRFEPVRTSNGQQILSGHLIKGNVDRLDATWKIRSMGDKQSHVELELLIVPKLPVPGSLVTGEVAFAADKAVTGVRDRAELGR